MKKALTRRDLMGRAGLMLGGAMTLGVLQACGSEDDPAPQQQPEEPTPQVKDFPYEQHLATSYQLDVEAIQLAAYHGYYAGGCCHGAYSALVGHLATSAGAPFDLLPLDFGKFGGGGIAGYGSICGAVLGGVLAINMVVSNADARGKMMTELMRWYERTAFPMYAPATADVDPLETGLVLDWAGGGVVRVAPGSHLCHTSVSTWCGGQTPIVSAGGADKKARCARLTADVAGKVAELVNVYLASGAFGARAFTPAEAASAQNTTCTGCHTSATTARPPVASGMECATCHSDKVTNHPAL